MSIDYALLFRVLLPEALLTATALLVIGLDLVWGPGRTRSSRLQMAVGAGLLGLVAAALVVWQDGSQGSVWAGNLRVDLLAVAARLGVLGLAALSLLGWTGSKGSDQPAEYVGLALLATVGFLQMTVAQNLLLAFLALELASLSLYVLAGYDRTRPESAEAALKYFLQGGVSAALLLFGFSLLYGMTGRIDLTGISVALAADADGTLAAVAVGMILAAFGFKAAVAPFHPWAPDVYQGAPAMSAALIASAAKLAGLVFFWRIFWSGLAPLAATAPLTGGAGGGWVPVLAAMAAVSLVLGNLVALAQTSIRRLLAYSAIGHAGALGLGLLAAGEVGPGPLFYYAATYGVATVGAFACLALLERAGDDDRVEDLAGLRRRSPLLATCLAVFVLSLAGIPPLAGFFGKFVVFAAAFRIDGLGHPAGWVALLAIAMSAVALYYYLILLKQAWISDDTRQRGRVEVPLPAALGLVLAAALLLGLGAFPSLLLGRF